MRALTLSALVVFALDQLSKLVVVHLLRLNELGALDVLPPYLDFRMAWNRGVNFGLFSGSPAAARYLLIGLALVVSLWIVLWAHKRREVHSLAQMIAAGAIVGGALGNAFDRGLYGAVADFLNMSCCGLHNPFAFNIADVGIFAGAMALVLLPSRKKTG